jgi:hypothetical protein
MTYYCEVTGLCDYKQMLDVEVQVIPFLKLHFQQVQLRRFAQVHRFKSLLPGHLPIHGIRDNPDRKLRFHQARTRRIS